MTPLPRPLPPAPARSLVIACLATAAAGAWGEPAPLGAAALAVILLILSLGWRTSSSSAINWALAGIFALFTGLIVSIVALDAPASPPRLWLGLPAPTALLVYGVWPLGILPSLLYAFRFRDSVLPEDRLERFLAEHSRRRK